MLDKKTKNIIYLVIASVMLIAGLILLYLGFYAPPKGQIHESILIAYGETLSFAGAVLGIAFSTRLAIEKIRREALEKAVGIKSEPDADD